MPFSALYMPFSALYMPFSALYMPFSALYTGAPEQGGRGQGGQRKVALKVFIKSDLIVTKSAIPVNKNFGNSGKIVQHNEAPEDVVTVEYLPLFTNNV